MLCIDGSGSGSIYNFGRWRQGRSTQRHWGNAAFWHLAFEVCASFVNHGDARDEDVDVGIDNGPKLEQNDTINDGVRQSTKRLAQESNLAVLLESRSEVSLCR
jgi:hypothetical protein